MPPKQRGYVYVIKIGGLAKIGLTSSPLSRFDGITRDYPRQRSHLICIFKTTRMAQLEQALHRHYDKLRSHGEWFRLSESDLLDLMQLSALPEDDLFSSPILLPFSASLRPIGK